MEFSFNPNPPEYETVFEPDVTKTPTTPTTPSHTKTPEELIGEAFKNGYNAGYEDGFENGTETAHHNSYVVGFEAGYAAAMKKVKEELEKYSSNL